MPQSKAPSRRRSPASFAIAVRDAARSTAATTYSTVTSTGLRSGSMPCETNGAGQCIEAARSRPAAVCPRTSRSRTSPYRVPDPARQCKLGRYVQGGDRGNPGNSSKHRGDQAGCGLTSDGEQNERKCRLDIRPRHDPIGTQLCRGRQYERAANSAGADCAMSVAPRAQPGKPFLSSALFERASRTRSFASAIRLDRIYLV
jgi:hypothetical protein